MNRITYLVVNKKDERAYLFTDYRKANKKSNNLGTGVIVYEFRKTMKDYWEELFQIIPEQVSKEINETNEDNYYTDEYLKIMDYLRKAYEENNWESSIKYPNNGLISCPHCGHIIWVEDLYRECCKCDDYGCFECMDINDFDVDIHSDCLYETQSCNGEDDYCGDCESLYCYNDECPMWDEKENGQSKSSYDEGRAFIENLDPNDPADAWFFED